MEHPGLHEHVVGRVVKPGGHPRRRAGGVGDLVEDIFHDIREIHVELEGLAPVLHEVGLARQRHLLQVVEGLDGLVIEAPLLELLPVVGAELPQALHLLDQGGVLDAADLVLALEGQVLGMIGLVQRDAVDPGHDLFGVPRDFERLVRHLTPPYHEFEID